MNGTYLTVTEAAEMSDYHPVYLRRLIRAEKIQAIKKGNQWWVDRASLVEYIEMARQADDNRFGAKD